MSATHCSQAHESVDDASHHSLRSLTSLVAGDAKDGDGRSVSSWAPSPRTFSPLRESGQRRSTSTHIASTTHSNPRTSQSAAGSGASQIQSESDKNAEHQKAATVTDRLGQMATATGSNALFGTLELLKLLGGATLSTTGKVMAPPLHITRTIILPSLWAAAVDIVASLTPHRVKDWFRILSSSTEHIFSVLKFTDSGKKFRSNVLTVGVDFFDCVTSEASRQVLVDGMASFVKLSEAMHTPETKALLEHLSVLGCRVVDAASTGRAKKIMHDLSEAAWSGIEVLADPAATEALAEVTAYMCHALEMEDAVHRPDIAATRKERAKRRYDRNRFEHRTYLDPILTQDRNGTVEQAILSSLGHHSGAESTGSIPTSGHDSVRQQEEGDSSSLPSKVVCDYSYQQQQKQQQQQQQQQQSGDHSTHAESEPGVDWRDDEEFVPLNDQIEWKDVDVNYLDDQIRQRATFMERQRFQRNNTTYKTTHTPATALHSENGIPPKPGTRICNRVLSDIEDLKPTSLEGASTVTGNIRPPLDTNRPKRNNQGGGAIALTLEEEDNEVIDPGNRLEMNASLHEFLSPLRDAADGPPVGIQVEQEESAIIQFNRVLDEIMSKHRKQAVEDVLSGRYGGVTGNINETFAVAPTHEQLKERSWYPKAAAAAGVGNENGQDAIKQHVSTIRDAMKLKSRTAIGVGVLANKQDALLVHTKENTRKKSYPKSICMIMTGCVMVLFVISWFSFGCFGVYIYFRGMPHGVPGIASAAAPIKASLNGDTQEIIIRVVREVVHVDPNGKILETPSDFPTSKLPLGQYIDNSPNNDAMEKVAMRTEQIAACVADSLN